MPSIILQPMCASLPVPTYYMPYMPNIPSNTCRFMFSNDALLEEEGARALLRTADGAGDGDGAAGALGDLEAAAEALGVEGEGEALNVVSFQASQAKADARKRDVSHADAIFGAAPVAAAARAAATGGAAGAGAERGGGTDRQGAGSGMGGGDVVRGGHQDDEDEDGPVVVMDTGDLIRFTGDAAPQHAGAVVAHEGRAAEGVKGQAGLSWRERALQARARKAAAEPACEKPAPVAAVEEEEEAPKPLIQLSWRDKAKARAGAKQSAAAAGLGRVNVLD